MTEAARSVGERDLQYQARFGEVTARLQAIGNLEDLTQIRQLVQQSASELGSCVDRMVADGAKSVESLEARVSQYEERLLKAERMSTTDALTGLTNRAGMEQELERRIQEAKKFCVIMVDLNGFKALNDTHGHAAGDRLLRASSPPSSAPSSGPWTPSAAGVATNSSPSSVCGMEYGQSRVDQRCASGPSVEYKISVAGGQEKVALCAAIGLVAWEPGQTAEQLFQAVDRAMYADKMCASKNPADLFDPLLSHPNLAILNNDRLLVAASWRAAAILRWTARISGILIFLFFLAFALGEGLPGLSRLTPAERLQALGVATLFLGLPLAWKWQGAGGLLTLTAFGFLGAIRASNLHMWALELPAAAGAAHLLSWARLRTAAPPDLAPWRMPRTVTALSWPCSPHSCSSAPMKSSASRPS